MLKLFFKKIAKLILCVGLFFCFVFLGAFFFNLVIPNLAAQTIIRAINIVFAGLLLLFFIFCSRLKNNTQKMQFIKHMEMTKILFIKDMKKTIISLDNTTYLIAITILFAPFLIFIALSINTPMMSLLIGTVLLLFCIYIIFSIVNGLIWYIVHKIWLCEKNG